MPARLSAYWTELPAATRGIALMLFSTVCFAFMHALIRHLSTDLHPFEIAFFRNAFGLLVLLPWLLHAGLEPWRTRRFPLHALRSVINICAMLAYFTALSLTPIAQVTALSFTAPIFSAILGMLILGEVFRLRRWSAIGIGFLGTLVILRPGFETIDTGSWLTLLSALLWGFTVITIRVLGRTDSSLTITTYMSLLLALLSVVPAALVWHTPEGMQWLWLLAIGALGTLGQIAVAQSLKEAEVGVVMPFDFCKLIWVAILGYLLFAEVPGLYVWLGGALIFAASTYIAYRENQVARAEAAAEREKAAAARIDGPV